MKKDLDKIVVAPNIDDARVEDLHNKPERSKVSNCSKCEGRILLSIKSISKIKKEGYRPVCGDCAIDLLEKTLQPGELPPFVENKSEFERFLSFQLERAKRKALAEIQGKDLSSALTGDQVLTMTAETISGLRESVENGDRTLEQVLYAAILIGTATVSLNPAAALALKKRIEEKMYPGRSQGTEHAH